MAFQRKDHAKNVVIIFLAEKHGCYRLDSRSRYLLEAGATRKVKSRISLQKRERKNIREVVAGENVPELRAEIRESYTGKSANRLL
jgi:hypothetical protein